MRLPSRPPQSRESTIVLDDQGRFWHDGELVEHVGLRRAFACWLGRHPDDGRFVLQNRDDWCYLAVQGTPYFVTRVHLDGARPELELFDESREPLVVDALWVGEDEILRARVKSGRFEARFQRLAQLQMAPLLDDAEPWVICIGERRQRLRHA